VARVTKEPEVRRDELLDVALDLCASVGFEAMSVEQVTSTAGVAKGTFYHYFSSKQDLLLQLVARFGDGLFEHLEREMSGVEGDALQRLAALVRISGTFKLERIGATLAYLPFLYRDENYTLRHRLLTVWLERLRPLLLEIVEQGAKDGTFSIGDADGVTTVLLTLYIDGANRLWDRAMDSDDFAETMLAGGEAISVAQERILGVPEGSLNVIGQIGPGAIESVKATLREQLKAVKEQVRNNEGGLS
jgi:AcrR family transcriptional regulator